jgi:hypothetical protein
VILRSVASLLLVLAALPPGGGLAVADTPPLPKFAIRYEAGLEGVARETERLYPRLLEELEARFGWRADFSATVFLVADPDRFRRMAGSPLVDAFAEPAERLVVMSVPKTGVTGTRMRSVLKHELTHLLLHAHIRRPSLPRWLDEGVAQWTSDGVAELLEHPPSSLLANAMVTETTIPLMQLVDRFPSDRRRLQLAYEQSRSFVTYIVNSAGEEALLAILNDLQAGRTADEAFYRTLSLSVADAESRWLSAGKGPVGWMHVAAAHLYEFLFVAGAMLTLVGFVRFVRRKRAYTDEDEDESES